MIHLSAIWRNHCPWNEDLQTGIAASILYYSIKIKFIGVAGGLTIGMEAGQESASYVRGGKALSLNIVRETPNQSDVIRLLKMSDAYMASLYPAESNHLLDVAQLEKPGVWFLVARKAVGTVVGCAALVDAGDGTAEIKRMFVDPDARGLKLGRRLMEALEALAREKGLAAIRLETGISQPEALGLYRSFGYREIGPFGSYRQDPLSLFMEKRLA